MLNRYVEFDTRWINSTTTTTSADGELSVLVRHSADGETWTDLGVLAELTGVNTATSAAAYRSGSTVYGMAVIIGNAGIPGKVYHAVLYDTNEVQDEEEVEPEIGQSFGPLIWAEFAAPDGTTHVWAPTDLPDSDTYYHGYKSPKLLNAGRVVRALSDEQGEYQGQTFEIRISDIDRTIRTFLGRTDAQRHLLNRLLVLRMISEDDWRAKRTPRTVAIGKVRRYRLS